MPFFIDPDDLHEDAPPLSEEERAWVKRLEKVLQSCPTDRLELITIGDPALSVFDNTCADRHGIELHDGHADRGGIVLAHVRSKPRIHGVSGKGPRHSTKGETADGLFHGKCAAIAGVYH